MKKLSWLLFVILTGCKEEVNLNKLDSKLLVATNYEPAADFSSYLTYSISDTLGLVSDNINDSIITGSAASIIAARIRTKMNERGFVESTDRSTADLGL